MTTELTKATNAALVEQVIIKGDLKDLTAAERVNYYRSLCDSMGLNPLTKPFEYIILNNKLTLYVKKDGTEQLRARHDVSITGMESKIEDGLCIVTAKASLPNGRTDSSTGAVDVSNLRGEAKANAMMKAETKAKRRVTLSIVGLGWLDESEIESIPDARPVKVDAVTGEITTPGPDTTSKLYCKQHNTMWFMKGKMTSYGHKIEGTNDWCHMPKETPKNVDPETGEVIPKAEPTAASSGPTIKTLAEFKSKLNEQGVSPEKALEVLRKLQQTLKDIDSIKNFDAAWAYLLKEKVVGTGENLM